jgi:hypothetical protein
MDPPYDRALTHRTASAAHHGSGTRLCRRHNSHTPATMAATMLSSRTVSYRVEPDIKPDMGPDMERACLPFPPGA